MATKKTQEVSSTVPSESITGQERAIVFLEVRGRPGSTLIQNNFAQKSIEEMLRKHMGLNHGREKKKPREVIENAKVYNAVDVISVPAAAVKKAMVTASATIKSFLRQKTTLRVSLFVIGGGAIPLEYAAMNPRMDMVRLKNGSPDVRFRPEFTDWKLRFGVEYDNNALNVRSIMDLVNRAGSVGLCEWRPEKGGSHGMFEVSRHITAKEEIEEIIKNCSYPLKPTTIPDWAMDADIDPEMLRTLMKDAENVEDDVQPPGGNKTKSFDEVTEGAAE